MDVMKVESFLSEWAQSPKERRERKETGRGDGTRSLSLFRWQKFGDEINAMSPDVFFWRLILRQNAAKWRQVEVSDSTRRPSKTTSDPTITITTVNSIRDPSGILTISGSLAVGKASCNRNNHSYLICEAPSCNHNAPHASHVFSPNKVTSKRADWVTFRWVMVWSSKMILLEIL